MDSFFDKQKSYLKKISNSFINFKKEGAARMSRGSCEVRMQILEDYWRRIEQTHDQILESENLDRDHEYFSSDFFDHAEEVYIQRKGEFKEFLFNLSSRYATTERESLQCASNDLLVKLPLPELPKFSGNFREWETFRDLMKSMVLERRDLSNVAKFQYLKGCLLGEASDLINTIPITEDNFLLAWQSLQNYYENTRRLTNSHLATLFDLKPMLKESASELRRIYSGTVNPLLALEALKRPISHWDDIIVFMTARKLDRETRRSWETKLEDSKTPPSYQALKEFLKTKIMTLDSLENSTSEFPSRYHQGAQGHGKGRNAIGRSSGYPNAGSFHLTGNLGTSTPVCALCGRAHWLAFCDLFKAKSIQRRNEFVKSRNICSNCFGNHILKNCISKKRCQKCHRKHHTLIHSELPNSELTKERDNSDSSKESSVIVDTSVNTSTNLANHIKGKPDSVLLCTAWVKVEGPHGNAVFARALIDQCAQSSFISESLCQRLRLTKKSISVTVSGIGSRHHMTCKGIVGITIKPRFTSSFSCHTEALVVSKVTSYEPIINSKANDWSHLKELVLADPHYQRAGSIDLLLGASFHARIIEGSVIKGAPNQPIAMNTALGWIISGETSLDITPSLLSIHHSSAEMSLDSLLQRFWQQEEVTSSGVLLTPDEQACENHFIATHFRDKDGRYVVRLPVIPQKIQYLKGSYSSAVKMLNKMENKFNNSSEFYRAYRDFMEEYIDLGHMQLISDNQVELDKYFFLPHHGVFKESTTTKLRVVFNGSFKTDSGPTLNDCLHAGPNLLKEIVPLITSWRKYKYAFTADIKMMFRQIIVHEADRHLQAIVWRSNPSEMIRIYLLNTLTYGLKCSPFIAIRVIKQLARDEALRFPSGSIVLENETYMDDVLSGGDDLQSTLAKQEEVISLCRVGGFSLRKWLSNSSELLHWLPKELQAVEPKLLLEEDSVFAVLGLTWQPNEDYFKFDVKIEPQKESWTKRLILSKASKLFDPLGFIAPIVINVKIFLQKLWILKLGWDEVLPAAENDYWQGIYNELPQIINIKIPRWIGFTKSLRVIQLHGFADASKLAYGAVLYLRTRENGSESSYHIKLIQAKTKVAPLKTISIPRLELSAAQLLAKLTNQHLDMFKTDLLEVYLWTDSKDVLCWLQEHPARWPTFVANRCSDIHTLVPSAIWNHIGTKSNPADLASRGCSPSAMINQGLWWSGPSWLSKDKEFWPKTSEEINRARLFLIYIAQRDSFNKEISILEENGLLPKNHTLVKLSPFVDKKLLRVGGRIKHSLLSYDEKHPLILPSNHSLTTLLIKDCHKRTLHGGVQLTLSTLRTQYWIIKGRLKVKAVIHNCITCKRYRATTAYQIMGNLPSFRVTPSRPFQKSGVDYAGPISLRTSPGRGRSSYKGFICIFICLATRAVHLEAVSTYSTEAFIAAFRRFVSRRGHCSMLISDKGTNFVGADKELKEMFKKSIFSRSIIKSLSALGTEWRFNPPSAPHFGGIWEAAVKSTKYHIRRVMGDSKLTFEEFSTLLCQVEACLNSRPLMPLSDDPNDYQALTPAHFLIQSASYLLPEPDLSEEKIPALKRWKQTQQMLHHFWQRWSREYLPSMQLRNKWSQPQPDISVGDLVLLRSESTPPARWPLARVTATHPGDDKRVRVVTVRTPDSVFKRPITKLVLLRSSSDIN